MHVSPFLLIRPEPQERQEFALDANGSAITVPSGQGLQSGTFSVDRVLDSFLPELESLIYK